ncbi:MAG: four helix bundle protein [Terriglobales bacterium]|jgi:four helix bundle protein
MSSTFRDLIVWQKSKALAKKIYSLTKGFPKEEIFGLTSQIRRAATSIPANIAEGKGRGTQKDFCHFLVQARGSLFEVETFAELASDLGYLPSSDQQELQIDCDEVGRMLNGLINSTKN